MKYFRWLSLGVALLFLIVSLTPAVSAAASSNKSSQKTVESAKSAKKSSASRMGAAKKSSGIAASDEREIWQKRAKASAVGVASWYGKDFHKKPTASGLDYDMYTFTAAHRTLPLGTVVKVTDAANDKSVMVCVTDRGPYVNGRIIDLSYAAAERLDLMDRGIGKVKLEVVSDEKGAPLDADRAYFVRYSAGNGDKTVGPFEAFADAATMQEALRRAHPEAEVILDKSR